MRAKGLLTVMGQNARMRSSDIGFKKMNWLPKQSAWNEHIQRVAKRRTMVRAFEQQAQLLANGFQNAFSIQITGHVDNVARTAADRIIAEGKKTAEAHAASMSSALNIKV